MAGPSYVLDKGFIASEALTKFTFVTFVSGSATTIEAADAAGERVLGVVQETVDATQAAAGRVVDVRIMGISKVVAGANLAPGDPVRTSATGRAVALAATTANQPVAGILMGDPAADGDWTDILLTPGVQHST